MHFRGTIMGILRLSPLGLMMGLGLVCGCGVTSPSSISSDPPVTDAANAAAPAPPIADEVSASADEAVFKPPTPLKKPFFIDDRYGPGELGPRILSHESEVVDVPPQRMEAHLRAEHGQGGDFLQDAAVRAAVSAAISQGERAQTLMAAGEADGAADKTRQDREGGAQALRTEATNVRTPRPVRVWEVREPRDARHAPPLAPAEVDTRAYLASLGIRSVYELSPGAYRLALPRGAIPSVSPLFGTGAPLAVGGGGAYRAGAVSPRQWEVLIDEAGRLFGLDPRFIAAMIKVESNFDHLAISSAGAQGAMQIMPGTQAQLGLNDPFDVRANIHAGCAFIRELLVQYGSTELALAAYNAGPGAVDKYGGIPPFAETREYVRRVMAFWEGEAPQPADVGTDGSKAGESAVSHGARAGGKTAKRSRKRKR